MKYIGQKFKKKVQFPKFSLFTTFWQKRRSIVQKDPSSVFYVKDMKSKNILKHWTLISIQKWQYNLEKNKIGSEKIPTIALITQNFT